MRLIRLIKDTRPLLALICILAVTFTSSAMGQNAALPEVLNLAPADAPIVTVIPRLSGLSQKIAKLNEQALHSSVPHMFDVLSTFKAMTGIGAGLNDNGSLMVVVTSANMAVKPPMVIVLPVLDYAAFVGNFGGNADEPVATVTLPNGAAGFAKQIDDYAVLGESKEEVENYQPGRAIDAVSAKIGATGKRCLTTSDVMMIFDIAALAPVLEPAIQEMRNNFDAVANQMPPDMPVAGNSVTIMMTLYVNAFNALVRDTSAIVVSLDITNDGVGLASTAQFKPNSHLARIFTTGGGGAQQLNRLPKQPYWLASGIDLRGIATSTLAADLIAAFQNQNTEETPDEDPFKMVPMVTQAARLIQQTTAMATVYYQPAQPVMMGGNFINGVAIYETTDGRAYTQAMQEYFQIMNDFFGKLNELTQQAAGHAAPDGHTAHEPQPQVSISAKYTPNALQVDGIAVDEYEIQYTFPDEMMQDMGPAGPMMMMMMGGAGQSGYVATKGNRVIMTTTRDAQVLQQAMAAIDQDTGLGTDDAINIVRRTGGVLPNSSMESYISIPGVMHSVNMFTGMMGMPPIQVPADLPPMATSASVENHGIAARLHIPIEVIQFCYGAAGQAMMMGRPGPAGPQPHGEHQHDDPNAPPPAPF